MEIRERESRGAGDACRNVIRSGRCYGCGTFLKGELEVTDDNIIEEEKEGDPYIERKGGKRSQKEEEEKEEEGRGGRGGR